MLQEVNILVFFLECEMAEKTEEITRLNPVARAILQGLYDTESPLHKLLGLHFILKSIWNNVVEHWKSNIKKSDDDDLSFVAARRREFGRLDHWDRIKFPKATNININMMPFVMGTNFKETKLPRYLQHYWENIIRYCILESEEGKIGYLTVHESKVDKGTSQRRPGIHTESPGLIMLKESKGNFVLDERCHRWGYGQGKFREASGLELQGGIFMASNVENSCRVWNCQIQRPKVDCLDIVGKHGDIEHLREFLPTDSETMVANHLYWITDRTPHESLPLAHRGYRQFFRLVTSLVGLWFENHSTKNPNGVVPDPKITKIVKGSKFDGVCCVIDP